MKEDTRFVYAARCIWFGPIQKTAFAGIPVCPGCGSPLLQYDHRSVWDEGVSKCDADIKGYKAFMTWLEGEYNKGYHAFTYAEALDEYEKQNLGIEIRELRGIFKPKH